MLLLQNLGYTHPNKDVLFAGLNLAIDECQKVALIGHNGVGKSTLLKVIAGILPPSSGRVQASSTLYYIPQHFGQYDELTVAQALRVGEKITALHRVLDGDATEKNLLLLDDDWTVEERSREALLHWGLADVRLTQTMASLSGGQKTKVFLAGIAIHQPDIVLLDEPSNHLDAAGRQLLYDLVRTSAHSLLVVSHDRKLLNLIDSVCELSTRGMALYGGNYEQYAEQKQMERLALNRDLKNCEKALRKALATEREALERKQKSDARGKKNRDKLGMPAVMLGMRRNSSEQSASRLKTIHAEKVGAIAQDLLDLRQAQPHADQMKFGFDDAGLHKGKVLFKAHNLNYGYGPKPLWREELSFQILSGERLALRGLNGSGKTTLIRLLLGELESTVGTIVRASSKAVFVDQDYSLLQAQLSVYEQAQEFNTSGLHEHEVKIRLTRFLFTKEHWDKPCGVLSGGERMRLALCCLMISNTAPDLIILDEPTNNLDIQNVEILVAALNDYRGTLLVVSHDECFLEQLHIKHGIMLEN